MNLHKNAESLAWLIVAVAILAIVMLWIMSMLTYWRGISDDYSNDTDLIFLKTSAGNIIEKVDLSWISDGEEFYICKDDGTEKEYYASTWSETCKYIDKFGKQITNFEWIYYSRIYKKSTDIWDTDDGNQMRHDTIDIEIKKYD